MFLESEHDDKVKHIFGKGVMVYWGISVVFWVLALLQNFKNQLQFNAIIVFIIIWVTSILMLEFVTKAGALESHMEKVQDDEGLNAFWLENPRLIELVWIPVGYGLVLGISYLAAIYQNPLGGIFGAGMVMLITLFASRSILVPIIIHGAFNTTVLLAQTSGNIVNSLLGNTFSTAFATLPFHIPIIGGTLQSLPPLLSEVLFQNFLVAVAEENLKLFLIVLFVIIIRIKFDENSRWKWFAGVFAVLVWSYLHLVQAL